MKLRIVRLTFPAALCMFLQQVRAEMPTRSFMGGKAGIAVDVKGQRHTPAEYPKQHPPWLDDRVHSVAPVYPEADKVAHRGGEGVFKMILDMRTGAVAKVVVVKSTGFRNLDQSAIAAFRQWRWRAGRWKEIEMPITFRVVPGPPGPLPRTSTLLSPQ